MTIEPIIFNAILHGVLSPWRSTRLTEENFRNILNNGVKSSSNDPKTFFPALVTALKDYGISLKIDHNPDESQLANLAIFADLQTKFSMLNPPDFYDKSSEFYHILILNETIRLKAAISTKISKSLEDVDKTYQATCLLNDLEYIARETGKKHPTDELTEFVLITLKLSIFVQYFEIKETYNAFVDPGALTVNELINLLIPNFKADTSLPGTINSQFTNFLSAQKEKKTKQLASKSEPQKEKSPFQPRKNDFRTGYKGKLFYEVVKDNEAFSNFESKLFENGFIDAEYNFTNKHNLKKEIAAIYRILIQKNFFKKNNYKHHNTFKPAEYRQYLDNRYNVDTSQQFRKIKSAEISAVAYKYAWLDNLPTFK